MKRRFLPALAAALTVTFLTGCDALRIHKAEKQARQDAAAVIAEREFLESFAADYAAWVKESESWRHDLPEPPLPTAVAD